MSHKQNYFKLNLETIMKKISFIILINFILSACSTIVPNTYRDSTVTLPAKQFDENELSKHVIVGSDKNAKDSSCTLMQRYKVTTNQNFTASMNLIKNRAALMGAGRIAIINHEELNAQEEKYTIRGWEVAVKEGTALNGADFQTTLVADLYDCSCPACGCSTDPAAPKLTGSVCAVK